MERNIITAQHRSTPRDYVGRMMDDKVHCMQVALQYGYDYWDGDRRYGFGGYRYDGRWAPIAKKIIETYDLSSHARILDVGCGKAHLLYELKRLLPEATVRGFDVSRYAIENAPDEIKPCLSLGKAEEPYNWEDQSFDLVLSLNCLHNLPIYDLKLGLGEIERVGRQKFIVVESYRTEQELFALQCWALTCKAFFSPEEWVWLFKEFGYSGDHEFIYF